MRPLRCALVAVINRHVSSLAAGALVLLAAPAARADDSLPALPQAERAAPTPGPAPGAPVCFRESPDGARVAVTCPDEPPRAARCFREELDGTRTETRCAPPPEPETESRWYGWQILIVDGGSIVTMPIGVGIAGYFLGGPIVHAAHGHWGTGALSLGVRFAGPALGVVAMGGPNCKGDFCGLGLLVGAAVGAVVAVGVDVAALAHEKVPVTRDPESAAAIDSKGESVGVLRPRRPTDRPLFSINPSVTPEMTVPASSRRELHGVSLGVSGTF